jgi:hypothetical protein
MHMSQTPQARPADVYNHSRGAVFSDASFGFMPAFMDIHNLEVHLSAYKDGNPAVVHILEGLPASWVSEWGHDGQAVALKTGVIAGFMRNGRFYTISEILNDLRDS